jgi:uncharacterized protein DUF3306
MSGSDQGNGDKRDQEKGFLARWSQRKQEARRAVDAPVQENEAAAQPAAEVEAEPEFDLSSLPKLEEVTGTTDISVFLRKGVPEHLRNAALRKSWALDPAIRNYVNPALEYAYDWNSPGGVPGSSEIGASTDVARLVAQIIGSSESAAPSAAEAVGSAVPDHENVQKSTDADLPVQSQTLSNEPIPPANPSATERAEVPVETAKPVAVVTSAAVTSASVASQQSRRHGSAKPTA